MARFGSSHVVLLAIIAMISILASASVSAQTSTRKVQACEGDVQGLIEQCAQFVQKGASVREPSKSCCDVVKSVNIPCVCQKITKEVQDVIDMKKVFHVASVCGRPLAHGTKCGGAIVP